MNIKRFWVVIREPQFHKHGDAQSAIDEAFRLAKKNPSSAFCVFELLGSVKCRPPEPELSPAARCSGDEWDEDADASRDPPDKPALDIDWRTVPDWAICATVNAYGDVMGWDREPIIDGQVWKYPPGTWAIAETARCIQSGYKTKNWKHSLTWRPGNTP